MQIKKSIWRHHEFSLPNLCPVEMICIHNFRIMLLLFTTYPSKSLGGNLKIGISSTAKLCRHYCRMNCKLCRHLKHVDKMMYSHHSCVVVPIMRRYWQLILGKYGAFYSIIQSRNLKNPLEKILDENIICAKGVWNCQNAPWKNPKAMKQEEEEEEEFISVAARLRSLRTSDSPTKGYSRTVN